MPQMSAFASFYALEQTASVSAKLFLKEAASQIKNTHCFRIDKIANIRKRVKTILESTMLTSFESDGYLCETRKIYVICKLP